MKESKISKADVPSLLGALVNMSSSGVAESDPENLFLKKFLPLQEHARALEPDTLLIIGDRGAGKTALFRAIQTRTGVASIAKVSARVDQNQIDASRWLVGYSSAGSDYPAEIVFRKFAQDKDAIGLQATWLGYLLRCLQKAGVWGMNTLPAALPAVLSRSDVPIGELYQAVQNNIEGCIGALDALDRDLQSSSKWIFITYDELDRVSSSDWLQLTKIVRGLIQFWSSNARRWRRLRPKIFLRRDLYDRSAIVGPDVSKITAQRVELNWTVRNLYALLAKRLVNQDSIISRYLGTALPPGDSREELGWFPSGTTDKDYEPMIEKMCGEFMGANAGKGWTFSWIPTHLQDSRGQVLPRSIVRLFEKAAEMEGRSHRAEWPRILHHTSLRGALDLVSVDRVAEIKEEFPWIEKVQLALRNANIKVPAETIELQRALMIDWKKENEQPPEVSPYGLLQFMGELGIFYHRQDGRVDVRDIYLDGFGLKRKGGVKKPF
jgi:hypothetical protein